MFFFSSEDPFSFSQNREERRKAEYEEFRRRKEEKVMKSKKNSQRNNKTSQNLETDNPTASTTSNVGPEVIVPETVELDQTDEEHSEIILRKKKTPRIYEEDTELLESQKELSNFGPVSTMDDSPAPSQSQSQGSGFTHIRDKDEADSPVENVQAPHDKLLSSSERYCKC